MRHLSIAAASTAARRHCRSAACAHRSFNAHGDGAGVAMTEGPGRGLRVMVMCAGCAEPSSYEGFVDPLDGDAEAAKDLQRQRIVQCNDAVVAKAGGAVEIAELVARRPPRDRSAPGLISRRSSALAFTTTAVSLSSASTSPSCNSVPRGSDTRSCRPDAVSATKCVLARSSEVNSSGSILAASGQVGQAPDDGGDDAHAVHRK